MKYFFSSITMIIISLLSSVPCSGQRLKLAKEEMKQKVGAERNHATIIVESAVEGLDVSTTSGDTIVQATSNIGKTWIIDINLERERKLGERGLLTRNIILRSPSSSQLKIKIPGNGQELQQATYYYTVILPDRFPSTISAEWLVSGATGKGFRIGWGRRYGIYASYKWGKYKPSGNNIDNIVTDCNVTSARELGYIRESLIVGARIGLFQYKWCQAFAMIGGGYGKYGRQWKNSTKVDDNIYFYSDYIKGFNGNVAFSFVLTDSYTLSIGTDAIFSKGKNNVDFEIGFGYGFKTTNWFKHKIKKGVK